MRKFILKSITGIILLLSVILLVGACSSSGIPKNASDGAIAGTMATCGSLAGMNIPSTAIGLATKGAKITSATLVSAADAHAGVEYCLAVGEIYPYTTSETVDGEVIPTPNINFNVALPTDWNNKTLHYGGGGFDGTVPDVDIATENGISSALSRGYATIGSDSGHRAPYAGGKPNELFNSEALRNFGREQIKKTHDTAIAIIKEFYKAAPRYNYFQGGSQGGHEALIAAQFYPMDYDGVIVGYPAYNLESMHLGSIDYGKTLYNARTAGKDGYQYDASAGDGWISRVQTAAISQFMVDACENDSEGKLGGKALDGAADGMISDPGDCRRFLREQGYDLLAHDTTNPLRCKGGAHASADHAVSDLEKCLSDQQIETLARITSRYNLPDGLAIEGGVRSYGRWPMLDGIWIANDDTKHLKDQEDFGGSHSAADAFNANDRAFQAGFPSQDQYQIITRKLWTKPADILENFDPADWIDRITTLSSWIDTSSADFSVFRGRGGKMIHYHGSADTSITPYNSIDFYLRMTGQFIDNTAYLGTNPFWKSSDATTNQHVSQNNQVGISGGVVGDFYSFYLIPGYGHGKGYYKASVDWLTALENWREQGITPMNNLNSTDVSGNDLGSRPLCYFPYYPEYTGAPGGDITSAENYSCTKLTDYLSLMP